MITRDLPSLGFNFFFSKFYFLLKCQFGRWTIVALFLRSLGIHRKTLASKFWAWPVAWTEIDRKGRNVAYWIDVLSHDHHFPVYFATFIFPWTLLFFEYHMDHTYFIIYTHIKNIWTIWHGTYEMRTTECDKRDTICVTAGGDL